VLVPAVSETTAALWTAIGTGILALATLASVAFAWRTLRSVRDQIKDGREALTQSQTRIELEQERLKHFETVIDQGQQELAETRKSLTIAGKQLANSGIALELSRAEIEEAHRPVLVPAAYSKVGSYAKGLDDPGEPNPLLPRVIADSVLVVPVENIGAGPSLNLRAVVTVAIIGETVERKQGTNRRGLSLGAGKGGGIEVVHLWALKLGAPIPELDMELFYEDVAGKLWKTFCIYEQRTGYTTVSIEEVNPNIRRFLEKTNFLWRD